LRPTRVLLVVSAAAVLAAACGGSSDDTRASSASGSATPSVTASGAASSAGGGELASLPATEILTRAQAALKAASSVHLKGSGSSQGESFTIDMRYGEGQKALGSITSGGQTIELRRDGQTIYVKADEAFWTSTSGPQVAKRLAGKYLKAPLTNQRVAPLATFTDKDAFTNSILKPDGSVTKGGTKEIRGTRAVGLRSGGTSGGGTLYIAAEGDAVPLQVVPDKAGEDAGQLDFLDYGDAVDVQAPPAAQTVDASTLGN
jgi:hypothetical protein